MPHITLTEEQVQIYEGATDSVEIRTPGGEVVARIARRLPHETPEFFAELKRRAAEPGPRYSGEHMQAMLAALETEWERTGGFDEKYLEEFIDRFPPDMEQR